MNTKWRRFEEMLPRQFNDGRDVPPEWISLAVLEIGDHFGSVSYETQIIEGRWQQAGVVYRATIGAPSPIQETANMLPLFFCYAIVLIVMIAWLVCSKRQQAAFE